MLGSHYIYGSVSGDINYPSYKSSFFKKNTLSDELLQGKTKHLSVDEIVCYTNTTI